jgi:rare lipoprotein A
MMKLTILFCMLSVIAEGKETGYASWYGKENRVSCKGKVLQHTKYPALAHRTLSIGSKVKVTNLKNNKTITAVVEDRGPYAKKRIADFNYAAAKELGMITDGVVPIVLEKL